MSSVWSAAHKGHLHPSWLQLSKSRVCPSCWSLYTGQAFSPSNTSLALKPPNVGTGSTGALQSSVSYFERHLLPDSFPAQKEGLCKDD